VTRPPLNNELAGFVKKVFSIGFILLLSTAAIAATTKPKWVKIDFDQDKSFVSKLYLGTLAQGVYAPTDESVFQPPVQYFDRHAETGFTKQSAKLAGDILYNFHFAEPGRGGMSLKNKKGGV
jgi:hypothetical protein